MYIFLFFYFFIVCSFIRLFEELTMDVSLCVSKVFSNLDVTEESWNGLIKKGHEVDAKTKLFHFKIGNQNCWSIKISIIK